ncbi:MAG: ubiquinol-cytochrome C chaperone [Alphaproteobacteria bacterium]|nr:ubiquinol-cytochrome C chaperone [Alphaproteobacteria bacterium]
MLNTLRRNKVRRQIAAQLYAILVERAREPVFFERFGVPDTLDGRFDLVALHAWLLLDRLQDASLAQELVDAVFIGFDEGLRELGAGDIGMGKRTKRLAAAFYGRLEAYAGAPDEIAMQAVLTRNLYRGRHEASADALARYVLSAKAHLAGCNLEGGQGDFGPLPEVFA